MENVRLHVEVRINPTEDLEKVGQAVRNIFGNLEFRQETQERGSLLVVDTKTKSVENLANFGKLLRKEHIRDAAHAVLIQSLKENHVVFYLNKQVAYGGHVSFCEPNSESPLGPIKVQIECGNPLQLISWLAPRTR